MKISEKNFKSLVTAMNRIAKGDMNVRVNSDINYETNDLTKAFNHMVEHLQKTSVSVRELNKAIRATNKIATQLDEMFRFAQHDTIYDDLGKASSTGLRQWFYA